jgi:hypothetical protein
VETVDARTLRERCSRAGVPMVAIAREAGMYPSYLYNILNGSIPLSKRKERQLADAIVRLGLDQDVTPEPSPVVIRLRIPA